MTTKARNLRKVRRGYVVKNKMDKGILVDVELRMVDPLYGRVVKRNRRYMAHDEKNECQVGDLVEIMEVRPLSKNKKWRLLNIVEKTK